MTLDPKPMTLIHRDHRAVAMWLALCLLMVGMMVLVGGYTRLSGSGLSITVWKPIHGVIPPLSDSDWQEEFAAYRESPQYRKVNRGMGLEEFKGIFWPEFLHRLLGRFIGIVFFLPLMVFALRRSFSRGMGWRLFGILALGGLQGLAGWLMVKSGLVDNPHVSHLRLAIHLSLAFAIFALILWSLLDISDRWQVTGDRKKKENNQNPATCHLPPVTFWPLATYSLWFALLCLQIIFGALVAGLHGGLVYNTWPDMNGRWLPDELFSGGPWYENIVMIQFFHRKLAIVLVLGFLLWWWGIVRYAQNNALGRLCIGVATIITVQFTLGVVTLLNLVPLSLALAHQMTALVLFGAAVIILWHVKREHRICRTDRTNNDRLRTDF